jgi:hypothetical protein
MDETEYVLIGKRRVSRRVRGYDVRFSVAVARQEYSPDLWVAWRGRFTCPLDTYWQQSLETQEEFLAEAARRFCPGY